MAFKMSNMEKNECYGSVGIGPQKNVMASGGSKNVTIASASYCIVDS